MEGQYENDCALLSGKPLQSERLGFATVVLQKSVLKTRSSDAMLTDNVKDERNFRSAGYRKDLTDRAAFHQIHQALPQPRPQIRMCQLE